MIAEKNNRINKEFNQKDRKVNEQLLFSIVW